MVDIRMSRAHAGVVAPVPVAGDVLVLLARELRTLAGALGAGSPAELSALEQRLIPLAADLTAAPECRSVIEALAEVSRAARSCLGRRGLAGQGGQIEVESLPSRMLGEIARGARVGNADLAQLLNTDPWQLSRAGRRLRDAGLATRTRSGRINVWELTATGRAELNRLRTQERRGRPPDA